MDSRSHIEQLLYTHVNSISLTHRT